LPGKDNQDSTRTRNTNKKNTGKKKTRAGEPEGTPPHFKPEMFEELGLSKEAVKSAGLAGYEEPSEIQRQVIPVALEGKDIIACSETGSGKTAAFVLPIMDILDYSKKRVQALVLVPTRELCRQVAGEFEKLGKSKDLKVAQIYGGVKYSGQRMQLSENPQVVVGTPGRVLDLLKSKQMNFSGVDMLVLDEADRMLDMGFAPQILDVLRFVPKKRQSLSFSATIPSGFSRIAANCMVEPVDVAVGKRSRPPEQLDQEVIDLMPGDKDDVLLKVMEEEEGTVLIFTDTKAKADDLYRLLKKNKHNVCVIHSDRPQGKRQEAIDGFRDGKFRIMVATDVASRGIDVEGISLVLNYDLPDNPEDYVHRIGRTGRADKPGHAISFVTYKDYYNLRLIEGVTGHTFKNMAAPAKSVGTKRSGLKRKIR